MDKIDDREKKTKVHKEADVTFLAERANELSKACEELQQTIWNYEWRAGAIGTDDWHKLFDAHDVYKSAKRRKEEEYIASSYWNTKEDRWDGLNVTLRSEYE